MTETHTFRIGILPLFCFTITLGRDDEGGARLTMSLHLYKLGFHFGLSLIG